jgi:hypothetical protein
MNTHATTEDWLEALFFVGKGKKSMLLDLVTRDRPNLSSERAPHRDSTETFRQKVISGHKFQSGLDAKTY